MKKIFIPLFLFLSFFISQPVFAITTPSSGDITITCNNSECTKLSGNSLFNETNIYPGFTTSQKVSIINNRNSTCHLKFKTNSNSQESNLLSQQISLTISSANSDTDYNSTTYLLSDLFGSSQSLGHIHKNKTNKYLWSMVFNQNAGNIYQNQTTNFNVDFNFECDDEESSISPTNSPTPGSVLGSSSSNSNQCTNSSPTAPTDLVATRNSDGSVRLNWNHSSSLHDGYLIAFGTSPGVYQYGAPNVGDVNNYTVQGLTYGAQYCFYVRSLNGCMPGDRTPEYCVNPGSNTPAIVPTEYQQNILGTTSEKENYSNTNPPAEVLGDKIANCSNYRLPIFFIIAFILNLIYLKLIKKDKLIPIIISLSSYFIDKFILKSHCCYGPEFVCNYFWIGSILSYIIPFIFSILKK
jgi:hypothetical protein